MTRTLIFGANGQLGVELAKEFAARGHRVTALTRRDLDITDASKVDEAFAAHNPEIVLNAAAYNQVDVAEKEPLAALQVNALAVRNLALACRRGGAKLVHFSTDYVFDGTAGRPYREEDEPHPVGAYAVSKLAGELYARAYLDDALVIRTCGVFGPAGLNTARGNFVELMLRLAAGGKPIRVVEDFVASPTYAPALAERTAQLLDLNAAGIVHLGGGAPISWFDWASKIFAAAGLKPPLEPTNEREFPTAARRPKYSALSNAKAEAIGVAPMPPLEEAIELYVAARIEAGGHA
jgi:dTDP-4-dehydrorhamnose reductase